MFMKREIKFRAWDGKRMTTSGIMFNTSTGCLEVPSSASFGGVMTTPYSLMQFTGLKDKNGVDIYEGDLLKRLNGAIDRVEFDTGQFVVVHKNGDSDYIAVKNKFEVIGNIYENPELL
jgi:uncharacterized phage protein (TIGR01671 family)